MKEILPVAATEPLPIEFLPTELDELEPYRKLGQRKRRELLKRVVGRKVLALVVAHYHKDADARLAELKRPVTLTTKVRRHEGFALLVIHYKLQPNDPHVVTRTFHFVSKNGGLNGHLYQKESGSYMETL